MSSDPVPTPVDPKQGTQNLGRGALIGRVLGSLGTVAMLSTILTYVLTRELGWMIYGKLAFGTLALVVYFLTSRGDVTRFFGARSTAYSAATGAKVVGFLAVIVGLNYIGATNNWEIDLTADQIFSLSDQTQKVMKRLDMDVEVLAFYRPEEPERGGLEALLTRYIAINPRLKLTFINPEREPDRAKEHQITEAGPRVIVKAGEREKKVKTPGEEELTNAIVTVAQASPKRILFLTGHGEVDTKSAAAEGYLTAVTALSDEGYPVGTVTLLDKFAVPEGTGALVVAAPKNALLQNEIEMIHGFLTKGGHVMILLEPRFDGGLRTMLNDWRIGLADDVVLDPSSSSKAFGFGPEMPIIQKLDEHSITKDIKGSVAFPSVRSVNGLSGAVEGVSSREILRTSALSWGEANYEAGAEATLDPDDIKGPVPIITVATKIPKNVISAESSQARLLVVGDHEFANNRFIGILGNRDLFLNAMNWLLQEEDRISIRPRARGASRLMITENQANFVKFFSIDFVPMALLAVGVAVWHVRRRR